MVQSRLSNTTERRVSACASQFSIINEIAVVPDFILGVSPLVY